MELRFQEPSLSKHPAASRIHCDKTDPGPIGRNLDLLGTSSKLVKSRWSSQRAHSSSGGHEGSHNPARRVLPLVAQSSDRFRWHVRIHMNPPCSCVGDLMYSVLCSNMHPNPLISPFESRVHKTGIAIAQCHIPGDRNPEDGQGWIENSQRSI